MHSIISNKICLKEKMRANQKRFLFFLSDLCLLFILFGCASPAYRAHPEFEMRARNIEIPALILSDVRIYKSSPGGVVELRDDWCAIAKQNLLNALLRAFKDKHYSIKPLTTDEEIAEEMEEIQALYRAVNRSIQLHTYGPQLFPEKESNFVYSLGPIEGILRKSKADSMVFVYGFGQVATGERKALVSIAVADSSGTIVWYCVKGSLGGYDLRDPESVTALVEDIFSSFPEASG